MAKRRTQEPVRREPTVLIVPKDEFRESLNERIKEGEEILGAALDFQSVGAARAHYAGWHDFNLELLKQSFNNEVNEYWKEYKSAGEWSVVVVPMGGRSQGEVIGEFRSLLTKKIENLKRLEGKLSLLKSTILESEKLSGSMTIDKSQVFIVHGHDEAAKQEVARFVEKLRLKPIILHEQASSGRTVIEKIEAYTNVGFAIVLYTPCDVGALKGKEAQLRDRARQNVVFEHGYLIAKIKRENVCALVKGDVEPPGDIDGVVYVSMQGDWKLALAKELRNSGYHIDMNEVI